VSRSVEKHKPLKTETELKRPTSHSVQRIISICTEKKDVIGD
jgi:hypothetical protein